MYLFFRFLPLFSSHIWTPIEYGGEIMLYRATCGLRVLDRCCLLLGGLLRVVQRCTDLEVELRTNFLGSLDLESPCSGSTSTPLILRIQTDLLGNTKRLFRHDHPTEAALVADRACIASAAAETIALEHTAQIGPQVLVRFLPDLPPRAAERSPPGAAYPNVQKHGTQNNSGLPLESMFLGPKNMDSKGKTLLFRVA